ncbi:MAG: hypothetical protein AVDCRST_MAG93-8829, partial [uncultured Chloroflexia bacterium]
MPAYLSDANGLWQHVGCVMRRGLANFEAYRHVVAFLQMLCVSNTCFDGHN